MNNRAKNLLPATLSLSVGLGLVLALNGCQPNSDNIDLSSQTNKPTPANGAGDNNLSVAQIATKQEFPQYIDKLPVLSTLLFIY